MQVVARQPVRVWKQCRPGDIRPGDRTVCRLLRIESLIIEEQFRIKLARSPRLPDISNILCGEGSVLRSQMEKIDDWLQVWCRG